MKSSSLTKKAILVNSPPASGKSTIASRLANIFHLPILARDTIQEALYDVIGAGDREYNRLLGRSAMAAIWRMLASFPVDAAVIIDTWFRYPPYDWVNKGFSTAGIGRFVEIWCHAPSEVLSLRYLSRVGERHAGHLGKEFALELLDIAKRAKPLGMGDLFSVDTSPSAQMDIQHIVN